MPSDTKFRAWLSFILGLVALAVSTAGHFGDRILLSILDPVYTDVLGVYGVYAALGMLLYAVPFLCGASLFLGIPTRSLWTARIGVAFAIISGVSFLLLLIRTWSNFVPNGGLL
jgi:hypothetical protein